MSRLPTPAVFLCLTVIAGCASSENQQQNKSAATASDSAKTMTRQISLDSVYSTSYQKELKHAFKHFDSQSRRNFLNELRRDTRVGASNVFLVKAKDFEQAVKLTLFVFKAGAPVDGAASDF